MKKVNRKPERKTAVKVRAIGGQAKNKAVVTRKAAVSTAKAKSRGASVTKVVAMKRANTEKSNAGTTKSPPSKATRSACKKCKSLANPRKHSKRRNTASNATRK